MPRVRGKRSAAAEARRIERGQARRTAASKAAAKATPAPAGSPAGASQSSGVPAGSPAGTTTKAASPAAPTPKAAPDIQRHLREVADLVRQVDLWQAENLAHEATEIDEFLQTTRDRRLTPSEDRRLRRFIDPEDL